MTTPNRLGASAIADGRATASKAMPPRLRAGRRTPHAHNLGFQRSQAHLIDRRLIYVWLEDNRKQRAMFEELKQAYVKARCSKPTASAR